eukprot:6203150-Heterocapsa_arctica.AAC.1
MRRRRSRTRRRSPSSRSSRDGEEQSFEACGNVEALMATNFSGRLDRKVEFGVPDLNGHTHIVK